MASPAAKTPSGVTQMAENGESLQAGQRRGFFLQPRAGGPFRRLRLRLVITNTVVAALILTIVSFAIYTFEAHVALDQVDTQLRTEAIGKAGNGLPENEALVAGEPEAPYAATSPNLFSVILSDSGSVIEDDDQVATYGLPDITAARPVLSGAERASIVTIKHDTFEFRLYTAPIIEDGKVVGAVQSGMSLLAYEQHMRDLGVMLVLLGVIITLLILVSSFYLTDRALAPARAAFERQRQFAAGASHELRTPLAIVRSLAELLAGHRCATSRPALAAPLPPSIKTDVALSQDESIEALDGARAPEENQDEVATDAHAIIEEVDYMARLVSDLLLLARDERDERALDWRVVDMREVVREVAMRIEPLAAAQDVRLVFAGDRRNEAPAPIRGDRDRLRELTLILLENAVRYTPSGGAVQVSVTSSHGWVAGSRHPAWRGGVTLTVRDTGVGIAPEDLPHLFEPFYRASSESMRRASGVRKGGSGLGLALAQWIVEAHSGSITVISAPGAGATFTVHFPREAGRRSP
jgi:two-component system sensor histidine kinase CiaH